MFIAICIVLNYAIMAMLTQIARLSDGLILAEAMDSDGRFEEAEYRSQAKKLFKTFTRKMQEKMTIESGTIC